MTLEAHEKQLFDRAKGPRVEVTSTESTPCPWCHSDMNEAFWDSCDRDMAVMTCPICGKESVCPDEQGNLVVVGLLSPADAKYLAWKEARQ